MAIEIQDKAAGRMLPAKLEAETAPSQQQPEQVLRVSLMSSKRSGKV